MSCQVATPVKKSGLHTTSIVRPPTRRKFKSDWDEALYVYHKIIYWFYGRDKRTHAAHFTQRMRKLLRRVDPKQVTVKGAECWSLVYEIEKNLHEAILHRKLEIKRMERCLKSMNRDAPAAHAPARGKETAPDGYDNYTDLADRFILLAILERGAGNLEGAVNSLRRARKLSETHGFRFEAEDLWNELGI